MNIFTRISNWLKGLRHAKGETPEGQTSDTGRPANVFSIGRTLDVDATHRMQFTGKLHPHQSKPDDPGTGSDCKLPITSTTVDKLRYPDAEAAAEERARKTGNTRSSK